MMSVLQICQFILTIVEIGMCYLFFDMLIEKKKKNKYEICIRIIVTFCISILIFVNRVTTCFINHFLYLFNGLVISLSICLANKMKYWSVVGVNLIYHSGLGLFHVLCLTLLRICLKNDERFFNEIYFETGFLRILILLVTLMSILGLYKWLKNKQYEIRILVIKMEKVLIIFGILAWWIIAWATTEIMYLSWDHGFWFLGIFLFILFTIGVSCYLFYYNLKQEMEIHTVQLKNQIMDDYYKDIKLMVENCLYTTHDLKNHIIVLKNYVKQKDISKIENYLDKIGVPIEEFNQYIWCENDVLNLIMNTKLQDAKKKNICVKTSIEHSIFAIPDNELCIILANLLDNAIEACEKVQIDLRWISIKICEESGCTIVKISNSLSEIPMKKNNSFISSKGDHHGLGLKSVISIVKKYNGSISCIFDKKQFNVIISV